VIKSHTIGIVAAVVIGAGIAAAQQADKGTMTRGEVPGTLCPGAVAACTSGLAVNASPQVCGIITAPDGSRWPVPSDVHQGPVAVDVYNDCTGPGDNPNYLQQLKTVVIDPDGVEITGYIFGDNYYELWVNGTFIARDALGMTPFNSTAVRFKAKYPITYAIKAVDWETHPGLGMEYPQYNAGDGGLIARFSDGTVTGPDWKVETFYIAPLTDPSCVKTANGHDSSGCPFARENGTTGGWKTPCSLADPKTCAALHFKVPATWMTAAFDDSTWVGGTVYKAEDVTSAPGYVKYAHLFGGAQFIWTRNLVLDNLVLIRHTVNAPPAAGR
jgi:hypothetical protein